MKTKVDRKAKKRSLTLLTKTSLPTKSGQKQKTVTGLKKNAKKAKLAGLIQNGNSTMGNKVQILKKMYKQKEKPKIKQTNIKSEIKTEEETKLPIAKLNKESVDKKTKVEEKKLKNLEIRQEKRKIHNKKRRRGLRNAAFITLSIEEIEAKIEEIKNREVLSKTGRKILAILNSKLRKLKKSTLDKSKKSDITEKKGKKNKQQVGTFVKIEPVSKEDNKGKKKIKKEHVEHETVKIKQKKDAQSDSSIIKSDDEDETDEDQSDIETEESMHDANEQFDDKIDEDEEDEDTEDDEDDEDEEDEDDEDEKVNISKIKKKDEKKTKKQPKSLEHQNKNQYVFFVGNLPYDVTADELKQHFLTKVDTVSNVRIPIKSDTKTPRGFAFVEVTNSTDFEKGLSLHHTMIKNRRIIVKSNDNKKVNVVKNFGIIKKKPQAFQKAKKLASGNQGKKKPIKKQK